MVRYIIPNFSDPGKQVTTTIGELRAFEKAKSSHPRPVNIYGCS